MKVYHTLDEVTKIRKPVLTPGTFDGVHLGHQSILQKLKEKANLIEGETVVFTFHPHPRIALHPNDHGLALIQTIDDRIKKLEQLGIDHLILCPFDKEFSRIAAIDFVRNILVGKLHIHTLVIGYNHQFGRNREGNIDLLRELAPAFGFHVDEIPAHVENEIQVSSTKIREAISTGQVKEANAMLGELFHFSGLVIKGDQLGHQIGFPTANLQTNPLQLLPDSGVFAVQIEIDGLQYKGMMNIGQRPTVSADGEKRVEVHVFDFNRSIYGHNLVVYLIDRVRAEQNFDSLAALKNQLEKDEINCRHILDQFAVYPR